MPIDFPTLEDQSLLLGQEDDFRTLCAARCADPLYAGLPDIKRIAAVGALGFTFGGSKPDDVSLTHILCDAYHSGLKISPDYVVDPINFMQKRDFLEEDLPYEAIVSCYIVGFPRSARLKTEIDFYNPALSIENSQELHMTLSRFHSTAGWHERIRNSGAQFIVTIGGSTELNTQDLKRRDEWIEVIPSIRSHEHIDFGYLATPDFLKAYRACPVPEEPTKLSQALRTCRIYTTFDELMARIATSSTTVSFNNLMTLLPH